MPKFDKLYKAVPQYLHSGNYIPSQFGWLALTDRARHMSFNILYNQTYHKTLGHGICMPCSHLLLFVNYSQLMIGL